MTNVTALQARLKEAREARYRAVGAYETARGLAEAVRADLEAEFGVSTVQEAEALALQLRDQLEAETAKLSDLLDQIGA